MGLSWLTVFHKWRNFTPCYDWLSLSFSHVRARLEPEIHHETDEIPEFVWHVCTQYSKSRFDGILLIFQLFVGLPAQIREVLNIKTPLSRKEPTQKHNSLLINLTHQSFSKGEPASLSCNCSTASAEDAATPPSHNPPPTGWEVVGACYMIRSMLSRGEWGECLGSRAQRRWDEKTKVSWC